MIGVEKVEINIREYLKTQEGLFLVSVKNTPDNRLRVFIDGFSGVQVEDCIKLSRYIESKFDRDEEDFSLEVSSAGIGMPFLVLEQYEKAREKEVEIKLSDGIKIFGVLKEIKDDGITIEEKQKGAKNEATTPEFILFEDIATTKEVITF